MNRESSNAPREDAEDAGSIVAGMATPVPGKAARAWEGPGRSEQQGEEAVWPEHRGARRQRGTSCAGRCRAKRRGPIGGGGASKCRNKKERACEGQNRRDEMVGELATRYRVMLARCNFLGCDRPHGQFAARGIQVHGETLPAQSG